MDGFLGAAGFGDGTNPTHCGREGIFDTVRFHDVIVS